MNDPSDALEFLGWSCILLGAVCASAGAFRFFVPAHSGRGD